MESRNRNQNRVLDMDSLGTGIGTDLIKTGTGNLLHIATVLTISSICMIPRICYLKIKSITSSGFGQLPISSIPEVHCCIVVESVNDVTHQESHMEFQVGTT